MNRVKINSKMAMLIAMFALALITACAGMFGPKTYIVGFHTNGGSGTGPAGQKVQAGSSIILPEAEGVSFGDATFDGWYTYSKGTVTNYKAGESFTPTLSFNTLYAKWKLDAADVDSVAGLVNKLAWLQSNAESNGNYIIEVNADESIGSEYFLLYPGKSDVTITLRGVDANRTISGSSGIGLLFQVNSGVTLVLDENITLQGHSRNQSNSSLIDVQREGTLKMNAGSAIIWSSANDEGDGVRVNGTFIMNGGTITGINGRGVVVGSIILGGGGSGVFEMKGGTISKNKSEGVSVMSGTFTMDGGNISNNTGGGVYVGSFGEAAFIMNGGEISRNEASSGGGVYVSKGLTTGTFIKTGGSIAGNVAKESNGGREVFACGRLKNSPAGPEVNLSFKKGVFSGSWD